MFNLDIFKANSRCAAVALGATVGAVTFSASAGAGPLPLFPFVMAPPVQTAPQLQAAPSQDEASELPARLRRQVVSYATREAPGTIIIDTPSTYLYLVCATDRRYATASASAATVSPGRACSRLPKRLNGRIGPLLRK